jgi:hypothetical protein
MLETTTAKTARHFHAERTLAARASSGERTILRLRRHRRLQASPPSAFRRSRRSVDLCLRQRLRFAAFGAVSLHQFPNADTQQQLKGCCQADCADDGEDFSHGRYPRDRRSAFQPPFTTLRNASSSAHSRTLDHGQSAGNRAGCVERLESHPRRALTRADFYGQPLDQRGRIDLATSQNLP